MFRKHDPEFDPPQKNKTKNFYLSWKGRYRTDGAFFWKYRSSKYISDSEQKQFPAKAFTQFLPDAVVNYNGSFMETITLAALTVASKNHHRIFREDKVGELKKRAVNQLQRYVVRGEQDQVEAMIQINLDLLLEEGEAETHARDLKDKPVIVKGTAFRLALATRDDEMALMIAKYLNEYYPGEKQTISSAVPP